MVYLANPIAFGYLKKIMGGERVFVNLTTLFGTGKGRAIG